jgi:hypothetical protein
MYVVLKRDVKFDGFSTQLREMGIHQWLYLGEDSTWRVRAERAALSDIPRISISDRLDEMAWRLRQPYIDWIGKLSQLNNSLEWWASELAGKNVYSFFYTRVCLLGVGMQLISAGFDRPTLVVCSTPALFEEFNRFALSIGAKPRKLTTDGTFVNADAIHKWVGKYFDGVCRRSRAIAGRLLGSKGHYAYVRRILADQGVTKDVDFDGDDLILFFTWVDHRNFASDGQYRDPHFGPLPDMLRDLGCRIVFVPRVLNTIPYEEAIEKLIQTGESFLFPELFLSDSEREACQRRAKRFNPTIPASATICEVPVVNLARELIAQYVGAHSEKLTHEPLIANLAGFGVYPRQIIHTQEGHTWEQALAWSVRQYMPNTKVVGYDNLTFSRMMLPMYSAQNEYGIRPLPDRIVTNGPLSKKTFLGEGMPEEIVEAGGALRHTYLWEEPIQPRNESDFDIETGNIRILIATAIGLGDSVELVEKASQAFGGVSGYDIIVKCHPTLKIEDVVAHLGELAERDNISFVTTPIAELLPSVHILLYTHTAVCYEALHLGVMPVYVRAENFLNLDKLDSLPEIRWIATTPEDLCRVVREILGMSKEERRVWQKRAGQIVRSALAPLTAKNVSGFLM